MILLNLLLINNVSLLYNVNMKKILDSIVPIINNSKHVKINKDNIIKFSKLITKENLNLSYSPFFILENAKTEEEKLMFSLIANAINFSYWGEPKWTIEYDNKYYDGSYAMIYSIKKALANNINILNPTYLEQLSESDFKNIFNGNIEIPLSKERLNILKEIGSVLNKKYNGSFFNIIKGANGDALKILDILILNFPLAFDDKSIYNNAFIYFYKKAQLFIYDLFCLYKTNSLSIEISNYDQLTMFADYKVPQMLRKFGIIEYSEYLSNLVDNKIEIENGKEEELEIRANSIWAVELIKKELLKTIDNITSADIDFYLWRLSQNKSEDDKPYHRSRNVWY